MSTNATVATTSTISGAPTDADARAAEAARIERHRRFRSNTLPALVTVLKEINVPRLPSIAGILRGLLRDGYPVTPGFKVADVDPRREELENCFLISDKARCIAGSVLELIAANLWK